MYGNLVFQLLLWILPSAFVPSLIPPQVWPELFLPVMAAAGISLSCPSGMGVVYFPPCCSLRTNLQSHVPQHTREGLTGSFQLSGVGQESGGGRQWGGMHRVSVSFVLVWEEHAIKQVGAFGFLTFMQLIALFPSSGLVLLICNLIAFFFCNGWHLKDHFLHVD